MTVFRAKPLHLLLVVLIIAIVAGFGYRYLPLNKLFKVRSADETGFVRYQQADTWPSNTLLFDFEVAPDAPVPGNLSTELAHSGKVSAKAFGKNSYSISFERTAGEIGLENLRAVSMSAWVYLFPGSNEPLASLVFAASNKKINIVWKGVSVKGADVPRGQWFKISGFFDLSGVEFKPDSRLEFYFWNNSDNDFLVDDLFIAFSGSPERPGDSTLVDLTRSPFNPRFNYPPFPLEYLEVQETGNGQGAFLVMNGSTRAGDLDPEHTFLAGPFISAEPGLDDLLVTDHRQTMELYTFCSEQKEFRAAEPVLPPAVKKVLSECRIIAGAFSVPGKQQLLFISKSGLILGNFKPAGQKCPDQGTRIEFAVSDQTLVNPFSEADTIVTGDFLGSKTQQVLALNRDGSWSLHRYIKGSAELFGTIARGVAPIPSWNSADAECRLTSGRFVKELSSDQLLTVFSDHRQQRNGYSMLRYNPVSKAFLPLTPGGGRIIGMDTLRIPDLFFPCQGFPSGTPSFFWYSQGKRFDLKRIAFSDTTYSILANVDFRGYQHDFNPKYYEVFRMVAGRFLERNRMAFLVIGKNRAPYDAKTGSRTGYINRKELPNTVQVYEMQKGAGK